MSSNANRSYSAAHFGLELDGVKQVGIFRSIEGGGIKTQVMTYEHGGGQEKWRQIGKPSFDDIKLQVGMSMSEPFADWIEGFTKGEHQRRTGAILAADFYYKERARREFKGAMIKELNFPKLEGQDKNAVYMGVNLCVEDIHFKKGSGARLSAVTGDGTAKDITQKLWAACNFRFELSGFNTRRVAKIDPFTIKMQVIEHHMGGQLSPIKMPSKVEFPNISFYVPEADSLQFKDHFTNENRIAVKNDIKAASKLHGVLTALDQQHRELFDLTFKGADIVSVTPDKADATSEEIKLVKVEIYTEAMEFKYKKM